MSAEEIDDVVSAFGNAAKLTKAAGFDGIEVHAGSGYLIDTFLQSCTNHREDRFGGSAEKRFTILSDVLAAISDWFPLSRVGVKFTPNNGFNGMGSPDVCETFLHYAARLDSIGIAYLHVTDGIGQARILPDVSPYDEKSVLPPPGALSTPLFSVCTRWQATTGDTWFGRTKSSGYHGYGTPLTLAQLKSVFHGALIGNGGYTAQTAVNAVAAEEAAAISFGRIYMTNPDLVERFRDELPLSPLPPMDEWFVPTEEVCKQMFEVPFATVSHSPPAPPPPLLLCTTIFSFSCMRGRLSLPHRAGSHLLCPALAANSCEKMFAKATPMVDLTMPRRLSSASHLARHLPSIPRTRTSIPRRRAVGVPWRGYWPPMASRQRRWV